MSNKAACGANMDTQLEHTAVLAELQANAKTTTEILQKMSDSFDRLRIVLIDGNGKPGVVSQLAVLDTTIKDIQDDIRLYRKKREDAEALIREETSKKSFFTKEMMFMGLFCLVGAAAPAIVQYLLK